MDTYTFAELTSFLDFLSEKGLANTNTVQGMRVAVTKVLVDLSPEEEKDIRRVDVALAVRRFVNKNPGALSPNSLAEYQRRVATAIKEFVAYKENPAGYTGYGGGVSSRTASSRSENSVKTPKRRQDSAAPNAQPNSPIDAPPTPGGLPYNYPLRPDFLVQVVLPRDLKADEAKRLCAFIGTLAVDFSAS